MNNPLKSKALAVVTNALNAGDDGESILRDLHDCLKNATKLPRNPKHCRLNCASRQFKRFARLHGAHELLEAAGFIYIKDHCDCERMVAAEGARLMLKEAAKALTASLHEETKARLLALQFSEQQVCSAIEHGCFGVTDCAEWITTVPGFAVKRSEAEIARVVNSEAGPLMEPRLLKRLRGEAEASGDFDGVDIGVGDSALDAAVAMAESDREDHAALITLREALREAQALVGSCISATSAAARARAAAAIQRCEDEALAQAIEASHAAGPWPSQKIPVRVPGALGGQSFSTALGSSARAVLELD
jgi:hypothetical protein